MSVKVAVPDSPELFCVLSCTVTLPAAAADPKPRSNEHTSAPTPTRPNRLSIHPPGTPHHLAPAIMDSPGLPIWPVQEQHTLLRAPRGYRPPCDRETHPLNNIASVTP